MGHIDKTRDNIKVESLNNSERKDLFNKMVKAGGQVVHDKPKRTINIDRKKQLELQQRLDDHNKNQKQKTPSFSRSGGVSAYSSRSSEPPLSGGLSVLMTRIKLFFMGTSNMGGTRFKKKFLEKLKVEYSPALMELQMLYLDLFKQNPNQGWKIIEQLDKLRPLYFELIEMTADVYDISIASRLLDGYTALPRETYNISDYRTLIMEYFKRLYILHRYIDTISFAYDKAISLQQELERGKSSIYSVKRRKAGNAIYVIFNKFFTRIHYLACLVKGEYIDLFDTRRIDEMLSIQPGMKPGSRIPNQPSSLFSAELSQEMQSPQPETLEIPSDEQQEEILPDEVKNGLSLMDQTDLLSLIAEFAKDDLIKYVSETDKVLTAFCFFTEFDREYSFIMTTYKIKFTPAHSIRGKSDYRAKLSDLYNQMRPCYDALKEYFLSLDIYEKARADRPTSHDQYFPYTKRLTELDRDKKTKGRNAKTILQNYMANIIDETRILINDMDGRFEIVVNPQDILEFDAPVEVSLKMRGKKIHEAVQTANAFASAFYYRLSPGGDIYGEQNPDMETKPASPQPESAPFTRNTPQASNRSQETKQPEISTKTSAPEKKNTPESILGELDDLL